ncbi:hypothetical protein ACVWXU_005252 [Streptomyces sp. TE33382]
MLDGRELSARSRRELKGIRYAIRLAEAELECLLQGIEYRSQGYENAQRWIDNSRGRLVTETANRLADELLSQGTIDWLRTALGESTG